MQRKAFWTTTLIISVIVIIALHAGAAAIFFLAIKEKPAEHAAAPPPPAPVVEEKKPAPKPPVKRTRPPGTNQGAGPDEEEPAPTPQPEPTPKAKLEPKPVEPDPNVIPEAPEPREVVYVAPPPRVLERLPPPAKPLWTGDWEKSGDIRIRVHAAALTRLPIIHASDASRSWTKDEALVIWLDVQNLSDKPRTVKRWQPVTSNGCTLNFPSGNPVDIVAFPLNHRFDWTDDYERVLEPGADPLIEMVFFQPPGEQKVTLKLPGKNVGEDYLWQLTIPPKAWTK
jgi:hypothetical protein